MDTLELHAASRDLLGKQVKKMRADAMIPAVVYGPDTPSTAITIPERELSQALMQAGATQLINLVVDETAEPTAVLAREIQRDMLSSRLLHVDFYQVRLTEKVKTMPRLVVVGEAPAVKAGIGVLIHGMTEIEVECLPTDLIDSIPVDISGLETLEDSIVVGDLPIPEGVTILADPDDVVISMVTTRAAVVDEDEEEVLEVEVEGEVEDEGEAAEED
jgi:large subunit ribosomal protein L25